MEVWFRPGAAQVVHLVLLESIGMMELCLVLVPGVITVIVRLVPMPTALQPPRHRVLRAKQFPIVLPGICFVQPITINIVLYATLVFMYTV